MNDPKVSGKEKELLEKSGIKPGEEATIWRSDSPHRGGQEKDHTDAVLVEGKPDGSYTVTDKEHVPG